MQEEYGPFLQDPWGAAKAATARGPEQPAGPEPRRIFMSSESAANVASAAPPAPAPAPAATGPATAGVLETEEGLSIPDDGWADLPPPPSRVRPSA